jgi:hypothetical protein
LECSFEGLVSTGEEEQVRITKLQLKRIIKEELENVLSELKPGGVYTDCPGGPNEDHCLGMNEDGDTVFGGWWDDCCKMNRGNKEQEKAVDDFITHVINKNFKGDDGSNWQAIRERVEKLIWTKNLDGAAKLMRKMKIDWRNPVAVPFGWHIDSGTGQPMRRG